MSQTLVEGVSWELIQGMSLYLALGILLELVQETSWEFVAGMFLYLALGMLIEFVQGIYQELVEGISLELIQGMSQDLVEWIYSPGHHDCLLIELIFPFCSSTQTNQTAFLHHGSFD